MLKPGVIESLPQLRTPVATIYLDTNLARPVNRNPEPGYLTSLGSGAKLAENEIYPEGRKAFREQVGRVDAYLRAYPPRSRGIVIFAGQDSWEFVPVEVDVQDEIHWGAPDFGQLLWLLDEHKPHGIVVVSGNRARFFLHRLGEMREVEKREFSLAPSKEKVMGPPSKAFGVRVSRGTNRDVYNHHRDAEYSHYYRQIAKDIVLWCESEDLESVFLLALPEVGLAIRNEIPPLFRENVVLVRENLGWLSRNQLRQQIEPILARRERERELALVNSLLVDDPRGLVAGIDETLVRLQQGRIRTLVVVKDLDALLKRCSECLWVDGTGDPVCPACGRERHTVRLRQILPELVRQFKASLEVVSSEAARKLQRVGGIGAWLCEVEKKEYSASA
jgi:hypothetical protein